MQIALSNQPTEDWFSRRQGALLPVGVQLQREHDLRGSFCAGCSRGRASSSSMSTTFSPRETVAAKTILHDPDAEIDTSGNVSLRSCIEPICETFGALCGKRYAIFRSRETGAYYRIPHEEPVYPENAVSYDQTVDPAVVKRAHAPATEFLKNFAQGEMRDPDPRPLSAQTNGRRRGDRGWRRLAAGGAPTGRAQHLDGYHLDRVSADRWARAFFEAAGPKFAPVSTKHGATHS